jgi:hypothetical protein
MGSAYPDGSFCREEIDKVTEESKIDETPFSGNSPSPSLPVQRQEKDTKEGSSLPLSLFFLSKTGKGRGGGILQQIHCSLPDSYVCSIMSRLVIEFFQNTVNDLRNNAEQE